MNEPTNIPVQKSWYDALKGHFDNLVKKLKMSKDKLIDIALYLIIGVLIGFLLKRFAKYVFFFLLFIGGMFLLKYYGFMTFTINWDKVHSFLGMQAIDKVDGTILAMIGAWIKANVIIFISFVIGLIIGWKIG